MKNDFSVLLENKDIVIEKDILIKKIETFLKGYNILLKNASEHCDRDFYKKLNDIKEELK
ncbi:MAG: hypothetical protein RRY22_05005 [Bacilli bacterium]